jgi:hypothetical protein
MRSVRLARDWLLNCLRILAISILGVALLTGCVSTQVSSRQIERLEVARENPRILVMPPDIRYYLLTAGGVTEPNAEWTEAAQQNFTAALEDFADSIGTELIIMDSPGGLSAQENQYQRLHSAVGMTLQINHFGMFPLPSKELPDNERLFDWSLGPGVADIGDAYDADYLLFVFYRDYQASGGRVALAIFAGLAGVAVTTGYEGGFASLVDLRTGDVVWFNAVPVGVGEMRDPSGAEAAVANLFADIPTG